MPKDDVAKRLNDGTFAPGESGNPSGRPKGSRNQITLLRESLELSLREQSQELLPKILGKAMELALEGDRTMLKLLLELHMGKSSPTDAKAQEKVTISINGPVTKETTKESEDNG